jgi:iron-sulfur cluster repair protein YtfE (RIC family)
MRDYNECQPYVDHLLAEHRRLHALLRQARSAIIQSGGPDRDASLADVAATLRHLREELKHHFAEEEVGGCLDEAVSRCPRLSAEARRIESEHPELLHEIDRLIAQALDGDQSVANRIALEKSFSDLCQQLHAHEAAENALLRQGFGTNVNGDENGQSNLIHDI